MDKYLLSIDNGLTSTKAVLLDLDGSEIASSLYKTNIENKNGYSEIDMELQWENTARCIKDVIEKSGIDAKRIAAVGNSGHGAGLYLLDGEGIPIRKAITSMDMRASDIVKRWDSEGRSSYDKTFHPLWPGQAIPILNWLKNNEYDNYRQIGCVFAVKDWIKFKLTGEIATEYTDATNSGLVNLKNKQYDSDIFNLFDIGEMYDALAPLRESTDIIGYVTESAAAQTGLKAGTPVTGGLFDVVACALGSGVYDCDKYSVISGTWNINSAIEKSLISAGKNTKCSLAADGMSYIYVESSATSAVNLEWFIDNMIKGFGSIGIPDRNLYKRINEGVAGIKPEESEIIYLPFLHSTYLADGINGGFLGVKAGHGVHHILRAVFEGVAFAHLMHLENLQKSGIVRKSAVLSGGASNSDVWCQIFSDVLNMEIISTKSTQAGALGVAASTALGTGIYKSFKEAVNNMVKVKKCYYPGDSNRIYKEKYEKFKEVIVKLSR